MAAKIPVRGQAKGIKKRAGNPRPLPSPSGWLSRALELFHHGLHHFLGDGLAVHPGTQAVPY